MPLVALYRLISHFVRNARFAERFTRKHVNARGFDFCFRKAYTVPVDDRFHVFVRAAFTYNRALPRSRVQGRGSVFRLSKLIEIRIGEKVRRVFRVETLLGICWIISEKKRKDPGYP